MQKARELAISLLDSIICDAQTSHDDMDSAFDKLASSLESAVYEGSTYHEDSAKLLIQLQLAFRLILKLRYSL